MIGQSVAEWARRALIIPPGHANSGAALEVAPYFVSFFNDAFQGGVIEAGWSGGRGQAKTTSCAALLLYFLVGPGYFPGWRGAVMATNGTIAGKVRDLVMELADASGLPVESRFQPQPGRVINADESAQIQFVNASKSAHLGASLDLLIADEMGEYEIKAQRNVEMGMTSCAKRGGLFMGVGVRAWSELFSEMRDRRNLPTTVWHEYIGNPDLPIDDVANIKAANPAVDAGILDIEPLLNLAIRSKGSTALEYDFRTYVLNQPAQPRQEMLVNFADWKAMVETDELPPRAGACVLGFDAGGSTSMTAAVAYWRESGRLEVYAAFPSTPDLMTRGQADAVGDLYCRMEAADELMLTTGRATDIRAFIGMLADALAGESVTLVSDRYRLPYLLDDLDWHGLYWQTEERGIGSGKHTAEDIRTAQKLMLSGAVKCGHSMVMMNAIRQATLQFTGTNSFVSLKQHKSTARIDAASALVLALGAGDRTPAYEVWQPVVI